MGEKDFFDRQIINISEDITLHLLDIETISSDFHTYLDKQIVRICTGERSEDKVESVKQRMNDYLKSKKDKTLEMGAIAEFFVHLYLNEIGYKQESMLFNLEENSIKKGFDGYYSNNDEHWLMESKSSLSTTVNASHENNISIAFVDLANKLSGSVKNNPWQNAYNHASHYDVNTKRSIAKTIKDFSIKFQAKELPPLDTHNIIPSSNIFFVDNWQKIDQVILESKLATVITGRKFKKLNIVCINNTAIENFRSYILKVNV